VNQLQRHRRHEHEIVGAPDVAHAAAPDPRDHAVPSGEHLAGLEGSSRRWRRGLAVAVARVLLVERQQRFGLAPQRRIVAARLGEKGGAPRRGVIERRKEHVFRALV